MDSNVIISESYIEKGQCALFLGPRFAMDKDGKKIHEQLKDHLATTAFKLDNRFDNLFIFTEPKPSGITRLRFNMELSDFYKSAQPHAVYDLIAQIPFKAIVSCSPDTYLKEAFDRRGVKVDFQYFSHKGNTDEPTPGPIVYNLYGNIGNEDSLITTFDQFYTFVFSLLGDDQKIPLRLKSALADAKVLLFFGFDLAKWYIPLILRRLNNYADMNQDGLISALISKEIEYNQDEIRLHFNQIDLVFMEEETLPFLNDLYEAVKSKGALIPTSAMTATPADVRGMIGADKTQEALQALTDAFQRLRLNVNDVVAVSGRFANLTRNVAAKTISQENAGLEIAQIRSALLSFCDQMERPVPV